MWSSTHQKYQNTSIIFKKIETRCFSCSAAFASVSPMERGADLVHSFAHVSNVSCLFVGALPPPSFPSPPHRCSRRRTKSIKNPQGFSFKFETRCFSCSVAFASVSPMERGAHLLRSLTLFSNAFLLLSQWDASWDASGTPPGMPPGTPPCTPSGAPPYFGLAFLAL